MPFPLVDLVYKRRAELSGSWSSTTTSTTAAPVTSSSSWRHGHVPLEVLVSCSSVSPWLVVGDEPMCGLLLLLLFRWLWTVPCVNDRTCYRWVLSNRSCFTVAAHIHMHLLYYVHSRLRGRRRLREGDAVPHFFLGRGCIPSSSLQWCTAVQF